MGGVHNNERIPINHSHRVNRWWSGGQLVVGVWLERGGEERGWRGERGEEGREGEKRRNEAKLAQLSEVYTNEV